MFTRNRPKKAPKRVFFMFLYHFYLRKKAHNSNKQSMRFFLEAFCFSIGISRCCCIIHRWDTVEGIYGKNNSFTSLCCFWSRHILMIMTAFSWIIHTWWGCGYLCEFQVALVLLLFVICQFLQLGTHTWLISFKPFVACLISCNKCALYDIIYMS